MADRSDIPRQQLAITATRCLGCGKRECPGFNNELYDVKIVGETYGLCDSCCRKEIKWIIVKATDTPACCALCEFGKMVDNDRCLCERKPAKPTVPYWLRPYWCPLKEVEENDD